MESPPDKYPHFQTPSFLLQDHMIFPSHADQPPKYHPIQHVHMSHRPFEFDSQQDQQQSYAHIDPSYHALTVPFSTLSQHVIYPPHSGLSLYSASGFDMLSILAKVATRPNPRIMLGPVDMTCSFVVADVRSGDAPIVYASPTFCSLTGYTEPEVLGRNCRFLQSPGGFLQRGDSRHHTAPDAVHQLYRSIIQEKECQASLINYRKDGAAFVNLVTLIPICADDDDLGAVTHYVGFQVDLAEQPNAIMQKLRDGSYIVNYSMASMERGGIALGGAGGIRKARGVSTELVEMLRRGDLTTPPEGSVSPASASSATPRDIDRTDIQSFVLDNTDDFIHVLSLKGSFLYVAPSISRVLGYTFTELIGRSISDLCHPVDLIPVMRQLKEASSSFNATPASQRPSGFNRSSSTIGNSHMSSTTLRFSPHHPQFYPSPFPHPHLHSHPHLLHTVPNAPHIYPHQFAPFTPPQPPQPTPRPITSLLFRARHKLGHYVWLLCRGRLHVEPGKGRKAVVMVGRVIRGPVLEGLMERELLSEGGADGGAREQDSRTEWGIVAPNGIILSGGQSLASSRQSSRNTLPKEGTAAGAEPTNQAIGRTLASFISSQADARRVGEVLAGAACAEEAGVKRVRCVLSGSREMVEVRFYATGRQEQTCDAGVMKGGLRLPAGVVFEVAWVKEGRASGSVEVQVQAQQQNITAASFAMPPNPATFGAPMQAQASASGPSALNVTPGAAAYSVTHIPVPTQLQAQHTFASGSSSRNVLNSGTFYSPTSTFPTHPDSHLLSHLAVPSPRVHSSPPSSSSSPSNAATPLAAPTFSQQHAITSRTGNSSPDSADSASPHPLPPLSLSPLSETSWKYELTRLRFENERLRAEAARLERKGRRRGHGNGAVGSFPPTDCGMKRPRED